MSNTEEWKPKYALLHFAAPTVAGGTNACYEMIEVSRGLFIQKKGSIGVTSGPHAPKRVGDELPISQWDAVLNKLLSQGWILYSTRKMEDKLVTKTVGSFDGHQFRAEDDAGADAIIHRLWEYSQQEAEDSYTYRIKDISKERTDDGAVMLADLREKVEAGTISEAQFNASLCTYYALVPRRMKRLMTTRLIKAPTAKERMLKIIQDEEEKLDFLYDQLKSGEVSIDPSKFQTITEIYGLEWTTATPEEQKYVKGLMDSQNRNHVVGIWKIKNKKTSEKFDKWCKENGISEENGGISHLWHGSPSQNWWSIATNGLWLKPSSSYHGSMFGHGLYFAPESDKSVGYASFGRWVGNGADNGFLALNKVATGKPFYYYKEGGSSADESVDGMKKRGTHCLWAQSQTHDPSGKSYLYRDEVIVYDDAQTTIEYLVEVERH